MPSLSLKLQKWARYEPTLPGQSDLLPEKRFYLELLVGLTIVERTGLCEALGTGGADGFTKALEPYVRMGKVSLEVDGAEVTSLEGYLKALDTPAGALWRRELLEALLYFNSFGGMREVFSVRPFGGASSTADAKTASAASQTVAH